MTVLYTTHLMIEAQKLSDRFGILDHGEIIALGTPGELILQVGEQDRLIFTVGEAAVGNETLERIRRPVLWILKPGNFVRSMVGGDNLYWIAVTEEGYAGKDFNLSFTGIGGAVFCGL